MAFVLIVGFLNKVQMSIWSEGIIVGGYGRRRKDLKNASRFNRNYENLEPYFPTVPEKKSFVGYWEDIDRHKKRSISMLIM